MVTTQNGTKMTDAQMRSKVEDIMDRKLWNTQRVALEVNCYESQLTNWLENSHETAFPALRIKLRRFIEEYAPESPEPVEAAAVPEPVAEPEPVAPEPTVWQLPDGFEAIAPLGKATAVRPAGVYVAKGFDRASLSKALIAALGAPARVLVASSSRELLITTAREGHPSLALSKGGDVSKSVAVWFRDQGAEPGFHAAHPAGDGTWRIDLNPF